jgi:hypothetical protein
MKNTQTVLGAMEIFITFNPEAGERKNKDRACVAIILKKERFAPLLDVNRALLIDFAQEYATHDRAWRKVLQDNPELRGTDWEEKQPLEAKAKQDLGYRV